MHFDTYFCFCFFLILCILLFVFHAEVSNFSDKLCCGLMMQPFHPAFVHTYHIYKIKVTAKIGLKILWIHCQNSALIINGIQKARLVVDIFDKRILDSLFHTGFLLNRKKLERVVKEPDCTEALLMLTHRTRFN